VQLLKGFFFFLFGQLSLPNIVMLIGYGYQSALKEVAVHAGHKVLREVDNNILLIVGNLQGLIQSNY
jgi:hypothetical protein